MSASLFDRLQLRSALAELFSSLGMEGDKAWRAAAQVRLLLSHADLSSNSLIHSEAFWADPDVRWLTGINEVSGTTYFNKELFDEMLSWVQLPTLLNVARQDGVMQFSINEIERSVSRVCSAAEKAGYKLDRYLNLLSQ
jgi:hypothetical protein